MIQLQTLNYLLNTNDTSFLLVNSIDKTFFSDYENEFVFIQDHIKTYGKIPDKVTFLSKFPDFDIIEVNESANYLLDELYSDRNRRYLANTFNKVRELLNADKVDEAMRLYTSASEDMLKAVHLDSVDILKDTSRYADYVDKCENFNHFYITTGLKELDDIIGGWDRNEELATIFARTNQGKTWLLFKFAVAAAEQGLTVGIYEGEMTENKVGYRIDTLISHISNSAIVHGNASVQNEYKRYIDSLPNKFKGSIKVLTAAMLGKPAGVTDLRAFIEKENIDILCVDQHSLLSDDRNARNPVDRAANISRDLKNLQVLKKIPILAVSQQNRNATDGGVDSSHIAQSDRIAQDSTILLAFEQKDGVLTLTLVKSRDSVNNKKLQYALDFDKGVFSYIPNDQDALKGRDCDDVRREYDDTQENGVDAF